MADAACSTNSPVSLLKSHTWASAHFVSISSCGTYREPQYDSHTFSTLLTVQGGYKLVIYGVKKSGQVLPAPIPRGDQWEWSLYDDCQPFAIVLGPGCTLYVCLFLFLFFYSYPECLCSLLPPGTPHAVFTVTPSNDALPPCVMFTSRYFSRSTLVQSLHGAISDSFWQSSHCTGWDVSLAKMMSWQIGFQDRHLVYTPFSGEHVYALIMFGKIAPLLESLPSLADVAKESDWLDMFDPEDYRIQHASQNPLDQAVWQQLTTVRSLMSTLADRLIAELGSRDLEEFHRFWTRTRMAWLDELSHRKEYEKLKQ